MFALLTLSVVEAKVASDADMIACMDPYVTSTVPAAGATDVPVDVAPGFIWADDCFMGGVMTITLELDGELIAEEEIAVGGAGTGIARLTLADELLADTEYRMVVIDVIWGETEVFFTTGSEQVQGAVAPEVIRFTVEAWSTDFGFDLSSYLQAELGEDPDGLSILLLVDEDGEVLSATPDNEIWHSEPVEDLPEEYCLLIAQEDGAGVRTETVEACAVPELQRDIGRRCSTTPLGASMLAGLFGILLIRRES